ncbi:MAG TPA: O-antigen ligase family protein, partial [Anaerolineae bacterium]
AFYFLFEGKGAVRKVFLVVALAVQFYALFLTYNRTSWYGLMISLTIIQFFYPQFRKIYIVLVLLGGLSLWATWDRYEGSAVEQRTNYKTDDFNGRTPRWEAGLNMWQAKPIRGWGFGWYEQESGRFREDGFRKNFEAIENGFLDIMVNTGLIGLVPYLLFLILPLVSSIRLFFRARAPNWDGFIKPDTITMYWCALIILVFGSYTGVTNKTIVNMIPFAIAGAIVGTHQHYLRPVKSAKRVVSHNLQAQPTPRNAS